MPLIFEESSTRCVCRARAVYRVSRGADVRYRCAACANSYPAPDWQAELLPAFRVNEAEDVYQHYRGLRDRLPHLAPELLASLDRFRDIANLEARYQRELQARRRRTA